jgi:hypothetical protein
MLFARGATMLGGRLGLLVSLTCAALLVQPCAATPFQWTFTGSLNTGREYHTATSLTDGRVLVAGGGIAAAPQTYPHPYTNSAELYDPATGTWTVTGSLHVPRLRHTATLLRDGRVLVAGGQGLGTYLAEAEIYDPAAGTWTVTGSLNNARGLQTATLFSDGIVLVAGGFNGSILASAELFQGPLLFRQPGK